MVVPPDYACAWAREDNTINQLSTEKVGVAVFSAPLSLMPLIPWCYSTKLLPARWRAVVTKRTFTVRIIYRSARRLGPLDSETISPVLNRPRMAGFQVTTEVSERGST